MFRPWSTAHNITLASLSLLLACNGSETPLDTETGSSSSSSTTQDSTSVTTVPPTTGDTSSSSSSSSTDPTTSTTGDTSSTTDPSSSSSTTDGTTTGTTGTGTTDTGTGTSTTGTGTSTTGTGTTGTGSSSTTGEPLECSDGVLNQDETDIDCGGATCSPCEDGLACLEGTDCVNGECINNICTGPTCDDLEQNGTETDVDCGGLDCSPCANDLNCIENADCASNICTNGLCVAPTCEDLAKNGEETDIDCGGPDCLGCADGQQCLANADCTSGVCTVDTCTGASCFDSIQNGAETGIDCGGPDCAPCELATLIINEIDYDQAGTDANEFIEIFNNTAGDVNLTGIEVWLINGAPADLKPYAKIKLGNGVLAQGQYLVIGPAGFVVPPNTLFVPFAGLTNQIQNGDPDGIALLDVPNKIVLDAFSWGGAVTNANLGAGFPPATSLVEGMAANLKDNADPARSLARIPNGNDKNNAATDWASTVNVTPGAANQP